MKGTRSSGARSAMSGSQHRVTLVDARVDNKEVVVLCVRLENAIDALMEDIIRLPLGTCVCL